MAETLHVTNHRNSGQRPRGEFRPKPKYEGKGHDALLRKMIEEKKGIHIRTLDGTWVIGKIITADKYTITIETQLDKGKGNMTVFKHSISVFYGVEGE